MYNMLLCSFMFEVISLKTLWKLKLLVRIRLESIKLCIKEFNALTKGIIFAFDLPFELTARPLVTDCLFHGTLLKKIN